MNLNFEPVCHEAKLGRRFVRITKKHWYNDTHKFCVDLALSRHNFDSQNSTLVDHLMRKPDGTLYWANNKNRVPESIFAWFDTFDEAVASIPNDKEDPVADRRQKALALRSQGLTYKEVGAKMNVTPERARQLVLAAERDAQ